MMKKIILFIFLAILFVSFQEVTAQSFEKLLPVTPTDTVFGSPEDFQLTSSSEFKNITTALVSYKIACAPIFIQSGHLYSICDCENCYMPQEGFFQTPGNCSLQPDETTGDFIHLYLYPNNVEGITAINVTFFNANNQTDNASYLAVFVVGAVDVNEPIAGELLPADVIPNPVVENVLIRNIPIINSNSLTLNILNEKGVTVINKQFQNISNDISVDVSTLSSGIYYFVLINNGKPIKAGNFVVSK